MFWCVWILLKLLISGLPYLYCFGVFYENLYSPNKHGRRKNKMNTIKTTQLQSRQKHLKLDSNLDTRLAHNTLGKANPKYSWQYFAISILLIMRSFMFCVLFLMSLFMCGCLCGVINDNTFFTSFLFSPFVFTETCLYCINSCCYMLQSTYKVT